ncbi:hypothetical protein [Pseudoalteromonas phage PH357]|nr:hypothetical protein [Pseudoalteromonas phage PH357]
MSDLDKFEEITDLNFDGENPHIAICHKSQGYSANLRHNALLFKSSQPLTKEVIKSLEGAVDESTLVKMSFNNKRRLLEEKIEDYIKDTSLDEHECFWVYVQDFNESMVVFNYHGNLYAMEYTESGETISLQGDPVEVKHKDLYVNSETGDELVKAIAELSKSVPLEEEESSENGESEGETKDTPQQEEDGDKMSDKIEKTEVSQDELLKSAAVQSLIKAAVAEAVEAKEKEIEKTNLVKSTTELLKGFSFVKEDNVDALVKSVLANEEGAEIVKALSDAQEKIEDLEKEVIKVKEDFGKQDAIADEVVDKANHAPEDRQAALEKAVKAQLEKQSK